MKASEVGLLDFLKKASQFIIPIYQRNYSWSEYECRQLWADIINAGKNDDKAVHFLGSVVYIASRLSQVSSHSPLLVIDGQQRLTTITLLLKALSKALGDLELLDDFSASKIKKRYLTDDEETDERHYKLLLSQTDKETLKAIVSDKQLPENYSVKLKQNYQLFCDLFVEKEASLEDVCRGLSKIVIVDIALTRGEDNPQLIFESMNSTGRELTQADLIRNYLLMGLEASLQEAIYNDCWRPMEQAFGQEAYDSHFDSFMRHYLTLKTGSIARFDAIYTTFKQYAQSRFDEGNDVKTLAESLRQFADYYCALALGKEKDKQLETQLHNLRELGVDVAYPLLLELYCDYDHEILSKDDFITIIQMIEAYVFRRAVCAIPTNSLNKTFAGFSRHIVKNNYLESIKARFLLLKSYRRFPSDDEFNREFRKRDLYNFRNRSYWLRRLENFNRKELVVVDEYTIEHILPQNPNLSSAWQKELGVNWKKVQEELLHTAGNLTLTGYNSEYKDHPFKKKKTMKGGFENSPFWLNKKLGQEPSWNEEAIQKRSVRLAKRALKVWQLPELPTARLGVYDEEQAAKSSYQYSDHAHLGNASIMALFQSLRKEILALDPCVTEEILKLYVAFKAETNFVDIIPQAKQLRLILNIAYSDISDPKDKCRDISSVGRWGNGDVEVKLTNVSEVPYVMGLIRQSLELQLGSSE